MFYSRCQGKLKLFPLATEEEILAFRLYMILDSPLDLHKSDPIRVNKSFLDGVKLNVGNNSYPWKFVLHHMNKFATICTFKADRITQEKERLISIFNSSKSWIPRMLLSMPKAPAMHISLTLEKKSFTETFAASNRLFLPLFLLLGKLNYYVLRE